MEKWETGEYKREMVQQKESALSCRQKHNSFTLCWREPGSATRAKAKKREKQGGRESNRERAEVVGEAEADNMLSFCKTDRKAVIREMESCYGEGGGGRHAEKEKTMCRELMRLWCQGIKTMSSSRTREQHTGREVILCNRCIMNEEEGRQCNVSQAWKSLNLLKGDEKSIIYGFDVSIAV